MAYDLSFTALSLAPKELYICADIYLKNRDLEETKATLISQNLLQKSSLSTNKRIVSELIKRVSSLTDKELELLRDGDYGVQTTVAYLSILKTYRFIYDFCVEVVRRKYLLFDVELLDSDWREFVESKRMDDEKLAKATETTIAKLKQVVFLMLSNAGILSDKKPRMIFAPILPTYIIQIIYEDNPALLMGFCMSDSDINLFKKGS